MNNLLIIQNSVLPVLHEINPQQVIEAANLLVKDSCQEIAWAFSQAACMFFIAG